MLRSRRGVHLLDDMLHSPGDSSPWQWQFLAVEGLPDIGQV